MYPIPYLLYNSMHGLRTNILAGLASLLFVATFAQQAVGQTYAQQVWDQLKVHYAAANLDDYYLENYILGKLSDDTSESWTFSMDASTDYVLTGACDNDCSDIDLLILNADGETVEEDTEEDDTPVVFFSPKKDGRYTVRVKMYACSDEPCYFGFGLFYK